MAIVLSEKGRLARRALSIGVIAPLLMCLAAAFIAEAIQSQTLLGVVALLSCIAMPVLGVFYWVEMRPSSDREGREEFKEMPFLYTGTAGRLMRTKQQIEKRAIEARLQDEVDRLERLEMANLDRRLKMLSSGETEDIWSQAVEADLNVEIELCVRKQFKWTVRAGLYNPRYFSRSGTANSYENAEIAIQKAIDKYHR